jgi:hypothetical protein
MTPIGEPGAMREVAGLLAVMALRNSSQDETTALMAIYASDLAGLPAYALADACKAFRQGALGDGKWAPTVGELSIAARHYMAAPLAEQADLRKIMAAEVDKPKISTSRKAELLAEAKRATQAMRMVDQTRKAEPDARAVPEPERKATIQSELMDSLARRAADYASSPVQLSDAALRSLRRQAL